MENQNIEWKSVWKDEFLKELCGFANAQGGVLEIGRADTGVAVGIVNTEKLLRDIPNTIYQYTYKNSIRCLCPNW